MGYEHKAVTKATKAQYPHQLTINLFYMYKCRYYFEKNGT